ncbi:hypothetical protein D3C72_2279130 [compost metagenome]
MPSPNTELASMRPPWVCAICWLTESPSPVPLPTCLVVKKGSKILRTVSSSIPQPLSVNSQTTVLPSG